MDLRNKIIRLHKRRDLLVKAIEKKIDELQKERDRIDFELYDCRNTIQVLTRTLPAGMPSRRMTARTRKG